MTLDVRLRPEAEQDLAVAAAWYEQQHQGLGHDFLDEVLRIVSSIAETPLIHAVMHRFPFSIYFRVESSAGVVVAVIMHASRDPLRWKNRT